MNVRPSLLCPIDFSEASAGALRYAAAIAQRFVTRLLVLTVEDPLLTVAMEGVDRQLHNQPLDGSSARGASTSLSAIVGKTDAEGRVGQTSASPTTTNRQSRARARLMAHQMPGQQLCPVTTRPLFAPGTWARDPLRRTRRAYMKATDYSPVK